MTLLLTIISGIISLSGTIPYIRDVVRGKTKPRVTSWVIWALLTGIAMIASFVEGHYPAAALAFCMTISCTVVSVLGLRKNGYVSFEKFDIACLVLALMGILLWYLFNSPTVAIIAVVAVDAIASLPTLRHAWKSPHEETLAEFMMAGLASCVTLVAANSWAISAVLYPIFIVVFDLTVVFLLLKGRRRV